jgi:phosphate transport system permease protein
MIARPSVGDRGLQIATGACVVVVLAMVAVIFGTLISWGGPALSLRFFTAPPTSDLSGGGILPAVLGTAMVTLIMTLFGVPVGVTTAVWLVEYAPPHARTTRIVRSAVRNLAAVPAIVFGLFGLGFFVLFVGRGIDAALGARAPWFARPSVLWSGLTLALLTLPVVIVTSEEALRAVPKAAREGALALGATRLQTVWHVVLPQAKSGILTGLVLAVSRGAGEVAPLLFTGVANYQPALSIDPTGGFMHLGHHVYVLATQSPDIDATRPRLAATALVLVTLTFTLNLIALVLRARTRRPT